MPRTFRLAAVLAAGAAILASAAAPARADVLRLENGKVMHGAVDRGYVDEECLRIQLFATGGTVKVRWEHLIAEDRDRWQVDLGLKESAEAQENKIDAHKVWFVSRTEPRYGLVLNPEALDAGPTAEVRLQARGKEEVYLRGQIAKVEDARIDLGLVYTPQQAFERKSREIQPNNGQAWSDLGDYARVVGAYDEAKDCYLKARDDPDFASTPMGKMLESKLATLEVLIRNKTLQLDLDRVKLTVIEARAQGDFGRAAQFFLRARDEMFRLLSQVTDKKLQAEFRMAELAQRVEAERRAFFQRRLPPEVYRRLRQAAYEKVREPRVKDIPFGTPRQEVAALQMKGTYEGARQYFSRQVTEDLWNGIMKDAGASETLAQLEQIMQKDPARLTDEDKARAVRLAQTEKALRAELLDFWQNRSRAGFVVTSYGYGTFIVVKSDLKLQRKAPQQGQPRAGGGAQQQAVDVVRTPDQWWEEAGANEKVNWLLSYYAERGGLLEVVRGWDEPCSTCSGLGYRKISVASTGEEEAERCKVCNGCKVERKVRWR